MTKNVLFILFLTCLFTKAMAQQKAYYYPDGIYLGLGAGYTNVLGSGNYKNAYQLGNYSGGYDLYGNIQWTSSKRPRLAPFIEYAFKSSGDTQDKEFNRTRFLDVRSLGGGADYYLTKSRQNIFLEWMVAFYGVSRSDSSHISGNKVIQNSGSIGARAGVGYEFSNWITPVRIMAYTEYIPLNKIGNLNAGNLNFVGLRIGVRLGQRIFQKNWKQKEQQREQVTKIISDPPQTLSYCSINVKVSDENSGQAIPEVLVRYRDLKDDKSKEVTANQEGFVELQLPFNSQYEIQVFGKGYFFKNQQINTGASDPCSQQLNLTLLSFNDIFETNEILFDYNSDVLKPESKEVLDDIIEVLKVNKDIKMEIRAHTDSDGSAEANKLLSNKRAASVVKYLVNKGEIASNRLIAIGFGESQLKYPETNAENDEGKRKNRRVELKVVE